MNSQIDNAYAAIAKQGEVLNTEREKLIEMVKSAKELSISAKIRLLTQNNVLLRTTHLSDVFMASDKVVLFEKVIFEDCTFAEDLNRCTTAFDIADVLERVINAGKENVVIYVKVENNVGGSASFTVRPQQFLNKLFDACLYYDSSIFTK